MFQLLRLPPDYHSVLITVTVRYYNRLKDLAATGSEKLQLDEGATVSDLITRVICSHPAISALRDSLLAARNNEYVASAECLSEGDAVDLMPPVSGG